MRLQALFFFLLIAILNSPALAELQFPTGIGAAGQTPARIGILQELSYGTSSKLIAEPYPAGGYKGLEVSMTYENVPTDRLNLNGNSAQDSLSFSRVTVGKGLFNNIDVQMSFIPFNAQSSVSGFGALMKWTFYEDAHLPYHFSVVAEGNQANFNNELISQSIGGNFIFGGTFDIASIYVGAGWLSSNGQFRSPEAPATTAIESVSNMHWFSGVVARWEPFFIATQLDQFQQTMVSFRLGVRL